MADKFNLNLKISGTPSSLPLQVSGRLHREIHHTDSGRRRESAHAGNRGKLGESGAASAYGDSAITQLVLGSFAAEALGSLFLMTAELTATRL